VIHMALAYLELRCSVVARCSAWSLDCAKQAPKFFLFLPSAGAVILLAVAPACRFWPATKAAVQVAEYQPTNCGNRALWDDQAAGSSPPGSVLQPLMRLAASKPLEPGAAWSLQPVILKHGPAQASRLRGLNSWPRRQRPAHVGCSSILRVMVAIGLQAAAP